MEMPKSFLVALACFSLLLISTIPKDSHAACPAPAQIVGSTYSPTSIQDAYDYARTALGLTDFTLRLAGEIFTGDLHLDGGSVVLDGGYDCSFTTKTATPTGIFGTVFISAGAANFAGGVNIVSTTQCDFDVDLDGFTSIGSCLGTADDCNDSNANVYPGASEICDGIDNNCDGQIDENVFPPDADGDGYYGPGCGLVGEDCNDDDATIHPGALDIPYDGIDQDCSGADLTFDGEICIGCHVGLTGPPETCTGLHDLTTAPDASCAGCHAPIVSNILPGHYGRTVLSDGNGMTAGSTIVCASCHDPNDILHQWGSQTVWPKVLAVTPNIDCDTCHENRAAGHETAAAHDNRVILAECGTCHTSDTTIIGPSSNGTLTSAADVDTLHRSDCDLCHSYTGSKLNTATVRQVIVQGVGGTPVNCTACHTGKATNHIDFVHPISVGPNDLSFNPPGILCGNCHNVSTWAEIEGVEHNVVTNGIGSCATCHNSTRQDVVNTIAQGLNPTHCLNCHSDKSLTEHGMVDHAALGYVTGGTTYCLNCHDGIDAVTVTHNFDCFLCHTSLPALKAGLPIHGGTCIDCHTTTWEGIHATNPPSHNALVQVATTSCGNCHSDPPPLADAVDPKVHDACSSCHDTTGGLLSLAIGKDFISGGNCTSCHAGSWEGIHPTAPQSHSSCTSCHNAATGSLLILGQ